MDTHLGQMLVLTRSSYCTLKKSIQGGSFIDLNMKGKTIKILEENIGGYLHDRWVGKEVLTTMKVKTE